MMRRHANLWLLYACLVLAACATIQTDQSAVGQRLNQAEVTATAAKRLAATLVRADTITADRAQAVSDAADGVFAAVVSGRRYLATGDATGAQERLAGVSAALTTLATFYLAYSNGAH